MNERLKRIIDTIWDFFYPKDIYCICCGNLIDQTRTYGLCDHCITHIKWNLDQPKRIPLPKNFDPIEPEIEPNISTSDFPAHIFNSPNIDSPNIDSPNIDSPTYNYIPTPTVSIRPTGTRTDPYLNGPDVSSCKKKTITHLELLRCTEYGIYERSIIFALKYNGHKYISRNIGEIMKDRLLAEPEFAKLLSMQEHGTRDLIIVPVPLHEDKYYKRGFNQAELMGKYLGKEIGIPLVNALRRDRDTKPMRGLGPEERITNVAGSMSIEPGMEEEITGKSIILIDDFYTTGSTALECARVLYSSGARRVIMLAFAAR